MEFVAILLFYAACAFVLIVVHESGHYLAGLVGGIPARDMRIRLFCFPQHVVLRAADQWVSGANIDEYVDVVWRYLKTTPRVYLYVSGGLLFETVFTITVSIALILSGWSKMALVIVGLSLLMFLPWLIIDTISIWRGRIVGDLSGLWGLARIPTAILVVLFLAARGLTLWYAAA